MPGLRSARISDRAALYAFLARLSPGTVQARYMSAWRSVAGPAADEETRRLLQRDESRHVVLVALDGAEIRGVGEFVVDDDSGAAELAVVVEDAFQRRGIGSLLLRALEQLARERGINAFTGDVRYGNRRVERLLHATGWPLHVQPGFGGVRFSLRLEPCGN